MIALAGFTSGIFLELAVWAGIHGAIIPCIILSVATLACAYKAIAETVLTGRELKATREKQDQLTSIGER